MFTAIPAPSWLPYRWRNAWDQARVDWAVRGVERVAAVRALAPEQADAELHMLVCRRDLRMAAVALKSLLRHPEVRLAVTLTNDGSLKDADCRWIDRQVENCRWLPRVSKDERLQACLERRPRLARLYESSFNLACKILHPFALARLDKVVLVDSDTAFFDRPEALMNWIAGDDPHAYYLRDRQEKEASVPIEVKELFADLASCLTGTREWTFPTYFFNSGLLFFRPGQCDLDLTEGYLEWLERRREQSPREPYFWFGDWTREQTAYMVMLALARPMAKPLGSEFHLGPVQHGGFNHFMRDYMIEPRTLLRLRELLQRLSS